MKRSSRLPDYRHYRALFEQGSFCGMSDAELLSRFWSQDDGESAELAFAVLVERHASGVMRICKAILGNESDAEDAFQATFLVLATKAGRLKVRETLGPWLASVARRIASRARSAGLARAARELRAARLANEVQAASIADSESGDDASVLHEEIDRLPERYRLPLLLCDLECQSHQEAAQTLGWPLGTVKSRQARARQRLRARLSRRGLSGALPLAGAARAARSFVPDSLIQSTAGAAASMVSRVAGAKVVSASVSTLVTRTLRTMIMAKLSSVLLGVFLTVSILVAATVVGQTYSDPTRSSAQPGPKQAPDRAQLPGAGSVFEYEIRIWKDGAPITPTMRFWAHPGETSQLKIPEGTVDLSFRPGDTAIEATAKFLRRGYPAGGASAGPQPGQPAPASEAHPVDPAQRLAVERLENALVVEQGKLALHADLLNELVDLRKNADQTNSRRDLLDVAASRAEAENKGYEKRLADIEKKLERILSVIDRVPSSNPARKNAPQPK
jgi:RNA polymerase sigma factor (sigma-70 family)